ncbi:hypothetical protein [Poseidonocella sp. HB161398]|uniref:hypothetical protein n=1 Tax=Poseidonocella sp. HB161398 TaxID=2320855 RepID=UPI001109DD6B|nr:hypothetical protein [Poseidonocella sp. HB161398]
MYNKNISHDFKRYLRDTLLIVPDRGSRPAAAFLSQAGPQAPVSRGRRSADRHRADGHMEVPVRSPVRPPDGGADFRAQLDTGPATRNPQVRRRQPRAAGLALQRKFGVFTLQRKFIEFTL